MTRKFLAFEHSNKSNLPPWRWLLIVASPFFYEDLSRFGGAVIAITFVLPNPDIAITRVATIVLTISLKRQPNPGRAHRKD